MTRTTDIITTTTTITITATSEATITEAMTKEQMITILAEMGYDHWYWSDIACDLADMPSCYDDICQQTTDTIAEALGIPTMTETEDPYEDERYCLISDIVNEGITAEMAEDEGEDEEN